MKEKVHVNLASFNGPHLLQIAKNASKIFGMWARHWVRIYGHKSYNGHIIDSVCESTEIIWKFSSNFSFPYATREFKWELIWQ